MSRRHELALLLGIAASSLSGCANQLETRYGVSRGASVNGTGALANVFRGQGDSVRTAVRVTDELAEWADVIVRFAPYPGPPRREEADWYLDWLNAAGGRRLIYVVRDFDALPGYLAAVGEPERRRTSRSDEGTATRAKSEEVADREHWFAVKAAKSPPAECKELAGPWSEGIVAAKAALARHDTIEVDAETVLLEGDGEPLAVEWTLRGGGKVLAVANASFLLNATLANPARRSLALRTVRWAGEGHRNVAFVEGTAIMEPPQSRTSAFALLKVPPFGWVVAQLLALGLAACLSRAPRLGRARPEPSSGEDRPVAHALALGSLMARSGRPADALAHLEMYRRWRNPARDEHTGRPPAVMIAAEHPTVSESSQNE